MALVRFTNRGDLKPITSWARPDIYETWLHWFSAREYKGIVTAMNKSIDRMDVVRTQ